MQRCRNLKRLAGAAALGLLFAGCASVTPPSGSDAPATTASTAAPRAPDPVPLPAPITHTTTVVPAAPAAPAPAPAEIVLAPSMPEVNQNLWERIRTGFAMPELDTPLVAEKERFYLQQPEYLQRMFLRGSRYLYHIVEEIEKRGLPTELALLPFVESAMNPTALSSAQAAGLWQFIPSTGKAYDLSQNWWVDNRRDVVHSTRAALDYLTKIHEMHGRDWFLALASYNWGENAVARAVKKNQAAGKSADYLSLNMPAETRHYVPKLIALKNIVMRSGELGITLPDLPNKPYFVVIEKSGPIDLKLAAQFAGMSVEEFVALNPAHNRPVIAASRNNEIKLPADRIDAFIEAVERHGLQNKPFASWQPYTMRQGETLADIARRGQISVGELARANDIKPTARPIAGTQILAPQTSVKDETLVESFNGPRVYEQIQIPPAYHRMQRRETLASVASQYRVSVEDLKRWNDGKKIAPGTTLMVKPGATQTVLTTANGARQVVRSEADEPTPRAVRVAAPESARAQAVKPASRKKAAPKAVNSRSTRSKTAGRRTVGRRGAR